MNDRDDRDDQALLARLRAADPASFLPAAAPARVARLLEETMSHDVDDSVSTESRASGTRGRSPLTWALAAAAVAVIVGGAAVIATTRDDARPQDPPTAADASPTVTELRVPDGARARCPVPDARLIGTAAVAFDGTVDAVDAGRVTLTPTEFYAGEATDVVVVEAPPASFDALLTSVDFRPGERYLVAATSSDEVMVCGMTATWSARLAGLYDEAFAG